MTTTKIRRDAWTEEHDNILVDTILSCLKKGKTLNHAYQESSKLLSRTISAVTFRWVKVIKANYTKEVEEAIKIGRELKKRKSPTKTKAKNEGTKNTKNKQETTIKESIAAASTKEEKDVISNTHPFVEMIKQHVNEYDSLQNLLQNTQKEHEHALSQLEVVNKQLSVKVKENNELTQQVTALQKELQALQYENEAMIDIMDRARQQIESKGVRTQRREELQQLDSQKATG